jgi:hypothetical protein
MEAQKSEYAGLPQRICLHDDLISTYTAIDPPGYASQIEAALDYMEGNVDPRLECMRCLLNLRSEFALCLGRTDASRLYALRLLELPLRTGSQSQRADWLALVYTPLCRVAHAEAEWTDLLRWSATGLEETTAASRRDLVAELYAWRAVALRWSDSPDAPSLFVQAISEERKTAGNVKAAYFDALSTYHELSGALDQALRVRQREVELMGQRKLVYDECQAHLALCKIRVRMEQPYDNELRAAREAATRLRHPEAFLQALDSLKGEAGMSNSQGMG